MGDKLNNLKNQIFDSPKKRVIALVSGLTIVSVGFIGIHKPVKIEIGDKTINTVTIMGTVQDVLDKHDLVIEQKDKVVPALDSKLSKHSVIKVKKAQEIVLLVDGKEKTIKTAEDSVKEMLKAENVTLDEKDRVEPSMETTIEKGQNIEVVRVDEKLITESEDIDFEVTTRKNDKLDKSVKKTVQEGTVGKREIKSKLIYENGKQIGKEIISDKVITDPKAKIIEEGTRVTFVSNSRGPESSSSNKAPAGSAVSKAPAGKTMTMQSTAYYTGTVTATGTRPKRNPSGLSTVAVDPRVIPLGSKLYIEGYGYAVAEDTGGAVKNNIVDVFLNTRQECMNWGRRNVKVTIVAYPGQW
ncbi:3D domain-containing protein [uncultured Clostridium sp.]|uniref:3D domain-containing protein n=1 Tax=uncultured Clostridium sp. TaxID=59620 RepID=UPI0026111DF9|nr:3D domain-containing protein [uncultured Clostridium sp.]